MILEFCFLLLIMVLFVFEFRISYNEMDVVPYARAVYNDQWLAHDWYLNLDMPYRYFFSYPVGYFVETFGIIETIIAGRLLTYVLIAFPLFGLMKLLKTSPDSFLYFFAVILFFMFFRNGSGAGEWMVGGLETKAFAYGFALLALTSFLKKQLLAGQAFAGLTLSFHLLVGIYSLFCLLPILFVYQRESKDFYLKFIRTLPLFLITASIGIFSIADELLFSDGGSSQLGWDFYVNIRVPHHTLPAAFNVEKWIKLGVFAALNLLFFLKSKKQTTRLIASYALFSFMISLVGIGVFFFHSSGHYFRYYFFRFGDIMLPLLSLLLLVAYLSETQASFIRKWKKQLLLAAMAVSVIILFPFARIFLTDFSTSAEQIKARTSGDAALETWVKANVSKETEIITRPDDDFFYINYERPLFVSWKHSPQSNTDIIEWHRRLTLLNRGQEFGKVNQFKQNYVKLTEAEILAIADAYPAVAYIIMPDTIAVKLPVALKTDKSVLYEVPRQE